MASASPKFSGSVNTVTPVKQRFSLWCWAACCEMFSKYHGFNSYNQDAFVTIVLKGVPKNESDVGSIFNSAAEPKDFLPTLKTGLPKAKSLNYQGEDDSVRFTREAIKKFIDEKRIMIFGADQHARILCGYGSAGGKDMLAVVDPADGLTKGYPWSDFDACKWVVYCSKI